MIFHKCSIPAHTNWSGSSFWMLLSDWWHIEQLHTRKLKKKTTMGHYSSILCSVWCQALVKIIHTFIQRPFSSDIMLRVGNGNSWSFYQLGGKEQVRPAVVWLRTRTKTLRHLQQLIAFAGRKSQHHLCDFWVCSYISFTVIYFIMTQTTHVIFLHNFFQSGPYKLRKSDKSLLCNRLLGDQ